MLEPDILPCSQEELQVLKLTNSKTQKHTHKTSLLTHTQKKLISANKIIKMLLPQLFSS